MHTFSQFFPLIKIAAAFGIMLTGIRLRIGLGLSILAGGGSMALFFGLPISAWPQSAINGIMDQTTLFLELIVSCIMVLSHLLEKTGQSKRLMAALSVYMQNPKLRLIFFPILIGLLPMPGGAVFSAPMVDSVSHGMHLKGEDKSAVNYWFRHVLEMSWPLYPGLLMASTLSGLPITRLAFYNLVASVIFFTLGYVFILKPIMARATILPIPDKRTGETWKEALIAGLPLITAIGGAIVLEFFIGVFFPNAPFEIGIIIALISAITCCFVQNHFSLAPVLATFKAKSFWGILWVILTIFVFKQLIHDAQVIQGLAQLASGSTALIVAGVCLPFLVGFISGITLAYVGSTFPIMLGLLAQLGLQQYTLQFTILGMYAGFTGIMVSPIHICFLVSCEYFRANFTQTWRRIALPSMLILFFGSIWFSILMVA